MAQNMIEDSKRKYEEARQYLIELMQAYGQRPIFVKTDKNGELVKVIGKSFVKHQTEAIGIDYPSNAVRKKCNKRKNPQLDTEKLTIVFLEAYIEFEKAYIEAYCIYDPKAQRLVATTYDWIERMRDWMYQTFHHYSEEELKPFLGENEEVWKPSRSEQSKKSSEYLAQYGVDSIKNQNDMMKLLWELAYRKQDVTYNITEAVKNVVDEEGLFNLFTHLSKDYSVYFKGRVEAKKKEESEISSLKKRVHALEAENNDLRKHDKVANNKIKLQASASRKVAVRTIKLLKPKGKLFKAYDFTSEADIRDYISWYKQLGLPIPQKNIKGACKTCVEPGSDALFLKLVEDYHSSLNVNSDIPGIEDFDDEL